MKKEQRNRIDILTDLDAKKNELEALIDRRGETKEEDIPVEERSAMEAVNKEISELQAELEATFPNPAGERNIKVVSGASAEERNFSLVAAIRNVVENRAHDEHTQAIINAGRDELARAGIATGSHIVIPQTRAAVQATIATKGLEAVATEKLDLIGPLYSELSLNKVGATFLTGLSANISIPVYSGSTVGWASEIADAADAAGNFSEIGLKPKRLTAYLDISRQFLLQDTVSAEALLRSDILESVRQKLEQTLLGAAAGSDTQPQGLFYVPQGEEKNIVSTYEKLIEMEMKLLNANASPKFYLGSPRAYGNLRQIAKPDTTVTDKNLNATVGASIVDSNSVSGIPLVISSNVFSDSEFGGYLLGDFSNYVIAQWGSIELVVDPYTQSKRGIVSLVVHAYFDAVLKRPTVLPVFTKLAAPGPENVIVANTSDNPVPTVNAGPMKGK